MSQGGQLANEIVLACDQIACSLYPTSFGICGFDITMFSSPLQAQIRKHCAISASVGGAALVCGALQQGCFAIMGQKLARRLRITLMSAILSQVGCHVPQKLAQQLGITSCLPSRPRWAVGYSRQTSEAGAASVHPSCLSPLPGGLSGAAGVKYHLKASPVISGGLPGPGLLCAAIWAQVRQVGCNKNPTPA